MEAPVVYLNYVPTCKLKAAPTRKAGGGVCGVCRPSMVQYEMVGLAMAIMACVNLLLESGMMVSGMAGISFF